MLLVDDKALVRFGLSAVLNATPGIAVVGECSDGSTVVTAAAATRPDVVLMDVSMPVVDGIEATRRLLADQPTMRVLILSGARSDESVAHAAREGAVGYLLKDGNTDRLVSAVQAVAAGGTAWPDGTDPVTNGRAALSP